MSIQATPPLQLLRGLIPRRRGVTFGEALRVAEIQAARLRALLDANETLERQLAIFPRLRIERERLSVSGLSFWSGVEWVIVVNRTDAPTRQRFTICHELKHIIDHRNVTNLYGGGVRMAASHKAELAADYFAGCLLVPRRELKALWGRGVQGVEDLASHFDVSPQAIRMRLVQTGLSFTADTTPIARCTRSARQGHARSERAMLSQHAVRSAA